MQDEEVQSVWEILIGWDRCSTGCVKPLEPLQTVMMWGFPLPTAHTDNLQFNNLTFVVVKVSFT